jgi:hypothetical protein
LRENLSRAVRAQPQLVNKPCPLIEWIRNTLTASAPGAQAVASRGFWRLPLYFTQQTLASTKVVLADPLPIPPLSSMGLTRFAEFERGDFDG